MSQTQAIVLLASAALVSLTIGLSFGRATPLAERLAFVAVLATTMSNLTLFPGADTGTSGASAVSQAGFLAAALVSSSVTILHLPNREAMIGATSRLFLGYALVASAGIMIAVEPRLVVFRVAALLVTVLTVMAVVRAYPDRPERWIRIPVQICALLLATSVIGALISPGEALTKTAGGTGLRLEGLFPPIAANFLGQLGVVVFAYSFGRYARRPWTTRLAGLAFVLCTQYRTGYIAVIAVAAVHLLLRGGVARRVVLVGLAGASVIFVQSNTAHDLIYRGENAQSLETLNSRTTFWEAAVRATARSPWVGLGLSSGTKHEVFEGQLQQSSRGSLHSTWVEAYTGTGRVGVVLLALAFAAALASGLRLARRRDSGPLLIMIALLVRSLTGSTIDTAGLLALILLSTSAYAHERLREETAVDLAQERGQPVGGPGPGGLRAGQRQSPRDLVR